MDLFDSKTISPMLIGSNQAPFDSEDYIFELKFDGIRCLSYLCKDGLELINKRQKRLKALYPELSEIYKQIKKKCILDGELIVLKDGKPDFFEVQRRSLMGNSMKIKLAAQKLPVTFVAFDILYYDDKPIHDLPLMDRKKLLEKNVVESDRLTISRFIEKDGIAFYKAAEDMNLEGIVAKQKESKYYFGKRTKNWIKMKAMCDEDFVVCGYYFKGEHTISVIIGSYQESQLIYQGHVVMGISRFDFQKMQEATKVNKDFYKDFPNFENAIWLKPSLVCTVQYMERTHNNGLRQPVFKGLRDDKNPEECQL